MSLFYLLITSGFVVNVHYCMGRLASVELGSKDSSVCGFCGMEENDFCCSTDEQIYKVDNEHQQPFASFAFDNAGADDIISLPFYQEFLSPVLSERTTLSTKYHSPPDPKSNQVFLYHCNFRI